MAFHCTLPAVFLLLLYHHHQALPNPTQFTSNHDRCPALLLLSGDIHINPGPRAKNSSVFPCGLCEYPVTWSCKGVACDDCSIWFHQSCIELCSADFELLNHSNIQWKCYKCNSINCDSFTFHSYELENSSHGHTCTSPDSNILEDSVPSSDHHFRPLRTSSPTKDDVQNTAI